MSNSPEATTEKSNDLAGQEYWRSFEEYAGSPEVIEAISQEFPNYSPDEIRTMSRRQFMQLAGASMALAGLTMTGCRRWPEELVVPYAKRPFDSIPGVPEHFASMMEVDGVAQPLLVAMLERWTGSGRLVLPLMWAVACLALFVGARRRGVSPGLAAVTAAAFGLTPSLVSTHSGGVDSGYADFMLAAWATVAAAGTGRRSEPSPPSPMRACFPEARR